MNRTSESSIDLSDLVRDPTKVAEVTPGRIAPLLAQLAAVQASMAARLAAAETGTAYVEETLLTVTETAERLGVSEDWLYRRTKSLPFVVRVGRHVRYSASGIDRYIRNRVGR